jgi:Na+-transporting methylmalonyl-CoA/oxaloacetate decarboxylase gamma subunit
MDVIMLGLQLAGLGLAGVFLILTICYILIWALGKAKKE